MGQIYVTRWYRSWDRYMLQDDIDHGIDMLQDDIDHGTDIWDIYKLHFCIRMLEWVPFCPSSWKLHL
jgi:hypothetical protein